MTRLLPVLSLVLCTGVAAAPSAAGAASGARSAAPAAPTPAPAAKPAPPAPVVAPAPPAPVPAPAPAALAPAQPSPMLPPSPPPVAVRTAAAPTSARVAITEFSVDGQDATPAIAMQLQDGFVVGLTRSAPVYVLDSIDVTRYMNTYPELHRCEGSICIKRLGQVLDVSHLVRVTATVTGNSYNMTARLFTTEGPTPALVPIDTQTRFCPVCTADEARQRMVQLGEAVKGPVETWLSAIQPQQRLQQQPATWRRPLAAAGVAVGFAAVVAGGALLANLGDGDKKLPALAGLLVGLGTGAVVTGCYVLVLPSEGPGKLTPQVALGGRF